ncbi:phospholipase D family protein [Variovorax sp. J22P271]|uniref:phospholipase D-like domain-containing protein n=1 Tax=Variovorax davisae TaxID=3053515 RepID=UPI0025762B13|nr:phospholipase D family protein [Variovorax sp. J22P271]MDM0035763.1 phospholipase D family protein [Variovorax sp. J22P271]
MTASIKHLSPRRVRAMGIAALVLALLGWCAMLTGCASLPADVARPVSVARTDVDHTRLAALAAEAVPADAGRRSGLRLLPSGDQAFEARIALARAAERSIDVQYYQIADDASGREFLAALCEAAGRGVRVRVLVDDLQAAGQDALLAGFAARPNVELRLFNPLPVREGSVAGRVLFSAHEFTRINRRMHNKLFIADGSFAISGGRNIGDDYFGRSGPVNFIDMDVLSAGPVVRELAAVFDDYWNSRHAYPIEALAAQTATPEAGRRNFDAHVRPAGASGRPVTARDPLDQGSVGAQLAAGHVVLHLAAVRVLADPPGKIDADAAAQTDGPVMEGQLALMQAAHADVLIASPYFVPGRRTLDVLQRATGEQVRVSVITNSLATTDEPLVHFGYARYRTALLDMGVALYELMPDDDDAHEVAEGPRGSLGRLHAKLAVVDGQWLSIGSMNMDRRSAHCNTEMGLVIDSPELAGQVASLLQRDRLPQSYQVRSPGPGSRLQWVSQAGAQEVVHRVEPNLTWGNRMRLSLLSMLVDEELL